jgi:hypothetical protein
MIDIIDQRLASRSSHLVPVDQGYKALAGSARRKSGRTSDDSIGNELIGTIVPTTVSGGSTT